MITIFPVSIHEMCHCIVRLTRPQLSLNVHDGTIVTSLSSTGFASKEIGPYLIINLTPDALLSFQAISIMKPDLPAAPVSWSGKRKLVGSTHVSLFHLRAEAKLADQQRAELPCKYMHVHVVRYYASLC